MDDIFLKANQAITDAIEYFLARINEIRTNTFYKKVRRLSPAFPLLKLGNDEFYEYAYYERMLECYVREFLINTVIHDLLIFHGFKAVWATWQEKKLYSRFSTEEIENHFPFEFIFINDEKQRIGVRYTGMVAGKADQLLKEYELDKIVQISWGEKVQRKDTIQQGYEVVTPAIFFEKNFSKEEYELFLQKILPAIEKANAIIGFETIPRLSLRYLSDFKVSIDYFLCNNDFENDHFRLLPDSKGKKNLEERNFSTNDYAIMNSNFQKKRLYKALLGKEEFAKCFITAEYQYQIFKQGYNIDYTVVACGYFKAVEQLIYKLLLINLDYPDEERLWIKKQSKNKRIPDDDFRQNPKNKKYYQVVFRKEYKEDFDLGLGSMCWFLYDNTGGWLISAQGRETACEFMDNFRNEARNGYFHKDNIDDFEVVSCIRTNAILIMYSLLGGYKLTGNYQSDLAELGIADDSFDRLYKEIQELPRGMCEFIIYNKGQEPIKAYRYFEQEAPAYDADGSVGQSRVKFVAVDEFKSTEYERSMCGLYAEREFYIQKDKIPEKISYINGKGEEIPIVW